MQSALKILSRKAYGAKFNSLKASKQMQNKILNDKANELNLIA